MSFWTWLNGGKDKERARALSSAWKWNTAAGILYAAAGAGYIYVGRLSLLRRETYFGIVWLLLALMTIISARRLLLIRRKVQRTL